ncbi:MAG: Bug family tripartite tricarboxylate transporter substrate binding protein [Litorivicinaceae bacterium]
MKTLNKVIATVCASVLAAGTVVAGGHGSVADFYKGKTVELYIGYDPGGGYDTYARLLARHIGKHIPGNPDVVPKNMPGAGSVKLTNWLWEGAPKDGTVFGAISRGAPFEPVLGNDKAKFRANKFNWVGSANNEVSVCATMKRNGITNWEQLKTQELTVGGNGSGSDTEQFPKLMNAVLGTKFKVIGPYGGGSDIVKAMEAGELGGRCGWSWSSVKGTKADLLASGEIVLLMQMSGSKHPELPDVPLVMDLAKSKEERQMLNLIFARQALGRPYVAPPDIPADRAKALQDAFIATVNDPAFIAEAKKMDLELSPISGDEVAALVAESYDTPQAVIDRAIDAIR